MSRTEITIERLTKYSPEDASGIGRLMPFLSEKKTAEPIAQELMTEIITSPHHELLVARLDGVIVGTATLSILMGPAVGRAGYLEDFVTDPKVRGKGVGSRLWDAMMAWCKEENVRLDFTSKPSRQEAHQFYLARGATIRDTAVFRVEQVSAPSNVQQLEDNARKFIIDSPYQEFLVGTKPTSYVMTTDWLETDEDSETKLAYKVFEDGEVQILHIAKVTENGKRTAKKEPVSQEQYEELLKSSKLKLRKRRHEFSYEQHGVIFDMKLDEFIDGTIVMVEVDAASDEERASFDPSELPLTVHEVTGEIDYYGYRIAKKLVLA